MDTNETKKAFLAAYKELGYRNKACEKVGIETHSVQYWKKTDAKFAMDYQILQEWWKEEKKETIERIMYDLALTPRGFMDRMAWLRKHYPEEYNPKAIVQHEKGHTEEVLKQLADKMEGYKRGKGKAKDPDSGTK